MGIFSPLNSVENARCNGKPSIGRDLCQLDTVMLLVLLENLGPLGRSYPQFRYIHTACDEWRRKSDTAHCHFVTIGTDAIQHYIARAIRLISVQSSQSVPIIR